MWAMGCIVAEMFSGKPLLNGSSTMNQVRSYPRARTPSTVRALARAWHGPERAL